MKKNVVWGLTKVYAKHIPLSMARLKMIEILGLKIWIHSDDHEHVHVYKGNPTKYEAFLKVRIENWEILQVKKI